jgi:hypothetical protein
MNGEHSNAPTPVSTDLVGDPLPETPSMATPLPWRVFRMNDCDWWLARTVAEARADYLRETGEDEDEARELIEEELDRLHFVDTGEDERPMKATRRPFREELARRVSAGLSKPEMFACTEY